ncbi:MAG: T9SS type A sorting domain-containing protein [Flavisolibacter sp.]|nr:T9SS type A sorting domain-containing protein [Flavisolibacter sp.]
MKKLSLLLSGLLSLFISFSQVTVTGNSESISTPVNAPAIIVDNSLSISSALTFSAARVSVSVNFYSGDLLSYTASLPSGITAIYNSGVLSFSGNGSASDYQTLFRSVTFSTSSTNAAQRTITFELGNGTIKYNSTNDHYYLPVSASYSWTAAKTEAESVSRKFFGLQGYLATVTSSQESTFVNALSNRGWLGGSDDYTYINAATGTTTYANQSLSEGKWFWVTGPERGTQFSNGSTALTWANWNTGEPNNSNSIEHYVENAYVTDGRWNDANNSNNNGFIIEYGGMAGDPVVDIFHSRNIRLIATSVQVTDANLVYSLTAPAVTVDNNFIIYSSGNVTNAKVTISTGFLSGDQLSYTGSLPGGVTASYSSSTGVLSFTGTATTSQWQTLLRTVTFYSSSTTIGNRTVTFSVGNLVAGNNGHFYEYVTPAVSWTTAQTNAAARTYLGLQGYLATITDATENTFIQQKLSADGWIGASDDFSYINSAIGVTTYANQSASEGKWYWVTGPEKGTQITTGNAANGSSYPPAFGTTYNNWNIGEPNNYYDGSQYENYAEIYSAGTNPGRWNDNRNSTIKGYVVEYGGLATDPLLQLSDSRIMSVSTVLPIWDLKFTVAKRNGVAVLNWSTAAESNTSLFEILRSSDGSHFTKIGEKGAAGNSMLTSYYSFEDAAPLAGTNFYKLKSVDIDGKATFSKVWRLQFDHTRLTFWPNPAREQLMISNMFSQKNKITIKNAVGAVVLRQTAFATYTTLHISHINKGIYYAHVISEDGNESIMKFIKE